MPSAQLDLILQFCIQIVAAIVISAMATAAARRLSRPVGTYGPGLPERRMRPRVVLQVRPVAGAREEGSSLAA